MSTAGFSSPPKHSGFCSIPRSLKSWLQQLRSNIHIIPLASKGHKASKIIFLVLNSQQRHTDRFQLKFQNEAELPNSYNFWGKWHLSGTEKASQNHQQVKEKGNLLLCILIVSWLVCQQMLWATLHMWSCQVTTSADVLLYHEHLGGKMKL